MTTRSLLLAILLALGVALPVPLGQFPGSVPDFVRASNGGILLDAKPSFSESEIYSRLEDYGAAGRANYFFRNLTVDMLLPFSVLPLLILLARRATNRARPGRSIRLIILALGFVYVAFDLLENASVVALLSNYPERLALLSGGLPYLTLIKRSASILALVLPYLAAVPVATMMNIIHPVNIHFPPIAA